MDAFSRKIVGYDCRDSLEAAGVRRALKMALAQLPQGRRVMHHSDRGTQYCCQEYVAMLEKAGASISMTQENHCYENAKAERLNGILGACSCSGRGHRQQGPSRDFGAGGGDALQRISAA